MQRRAMIFKTDNRIYTVSGNILLLLIIIALHACTNRMNPDSYTILRVADAIPEYAIVDDSTENPSFHPLSIVKEIPGSDSFRIVSLIPLNERDILMITRNHGLYRIKKLGEGWERIDRDLPPEVLYPFKESGRTKPIMSVSIAHNRKHLALIVESMLYLSDDGGITFTRAPLNGLRNFTSPLTVALHPSNPSTLLLGTATSGIYYSDDYGKSVSPIRKGVPGEPLRSPNFLEEVRSLCFAENDTFYAGFANGNGVYRGTISEKSLEKIDRPDLYAYPDGDFYTVNSLSYYRGILWIGTNRRVRSTMIIDPGKHRRDDPVIGIAEKVMKEKPPIFLYTRDCSISFGKHYLPEREFTPDKRALGKHGLYISYSFTQGENYSRLIRLLRTLRLNAVVINVKDDYGKTRVPTDDPLILQVPDSVAPYINVKETFDRLHRDGIYIIGRHVVFKDEPLYRFENGKYAVKNRGGRPLLKGPEKWVDAYSEFVWDYNIAVAKAIVQAGVDEIQFDYIRFPDIRGGIDVRKFDFQKKDQSQREALVSFLKKARENLKVPLSIDLFGYNAIYQWGTWIGQDVTALSRYVDVISPMFYPSHYTGGYAYSYGAKRIYYTIYISCKRVKELAGGVHIRPYIQAFYYKENTDNYCVDYIGWELDGLKESGLTDYIFWNDLSEYKILLRGMRKYLGLGEGPLPPEMLKIIPKKLPLEDVVESK